MAIYENIRNLREDNDLTQAALAEILHISQRAYSHYENGTREIPIALLIQLSQYYDVSIDYILGETNIKTRIGKMKSRDSITILKSKDPKLYDIAYHALSFDKDNTDRLYIYYKELFRQHKRGLKKIK